MTKLEQLIQELCPNGVEYKTLGEIAEYSKTRIPISTITVDEYIGVENLLQNKAGRTTASSLPLNTDVAIAFECDDILIGNIRPYLRKIWLADCNGGTNGDVLTVHINDKAVVMPRFLYYVLSSEKFFFYDIQNSKGAKMPRGDKAAVMRYICPIPPLEVQAEIVRILDKFTELTTELATELANRKKQYEYYRDNLLTFDEDVKWKTLGDIGKVSMCKRIMKNETSSDGDVPFYKIGTFGKEPDAYISFETFEKYRTNYSYPNKGDILISAAGTIGRTVVFDGKPSYFQDSNIVWIANDETKVTNRFLYYWYQTNPWKASTGGTIARLYNDNISKARVPVLPLEKQKRIVAILDRFDKLCNDISEGLPAEIDARQKQYEYYRDKLLTFSKASEAL